MRRYVWCAAVVLALSGAVLGAQKVTTPDALDKAMKAAGKASGAARTAVTSGDVAAAKTQLVTLRQAIKDSENLWAEKKKADGVKAVADTLARIDEAEKALSAATPDKDAASAALRGMATACGSCHMVYRATSEEGGFVLKPGTL